MTYINGNILNGLDYISSKQEKQMGIGGNDLGKAVSPKDIYKMVTDRIIEQIEKDGELHWDRGWADKKGLSASQNLVALPINYSSLNYYRGVNILMLTFYPKGVPVIKDGQERIKTVYEQIDDNRLFWLTFKQIKEANGKLKKGSKANQAVYYNFIYKYKGQKISEIKYRNLAKQFRCGTSQANEQECSFLDRMAFLKYYNVYNERDIEGVDFEAKRKEIKDKYKTFKSKREKIEVAELVVKHMPNKPQIQEVKLNSGQSPHYTPGKDIVVVPMREQYKDLAIFYGTLFHELTHSTGHQKRLARPGIVDFDGFGSESYAFEELVAEIGSAFLNAESGTLLSTLKKNTAYIKGWKQAVTKMLKKDNKAIFKASGQAQKSADYILDRDKNGTPSFYKDLKHLKTEKTTKKPQVKVKKATGTEQKLIALIEDAQAEYIKRKHRVSRANLENAQWQYFTEIVTQDWSKFETLYNLSKKAKSKPLLFNLSGVFEEELFFKNLDQNLWKYIPNEFKQAQAIKKVDFEATTNSKGLELITKNIVAHDDLRPVMAKVFFDKENKDIVATDAHKLLNIDIKTKHKTGAYCLHKFCKKWDGAGSTYPNYRQIMPNIQKDYGSLPLHLEGLRIYLNAILKLQPKYSTSYLKIAKNYSFNTQVLSDAIEALLKLGYKEISIAFNNVDVNNHRAFVLFPKGNFMKIQDFRTDFVLVMPMTRNPLKNELIYDVKNNTVSTYNRRFDPVKIISKNPIVSPQKKKTKSKSEQEAEAMAIALEMELELMEL